MGNYAKTNRHDEGRCPYWALESYSECGLSKGGVYIPLPEHVQMYCLSGNYDLCCQYVKGFGLMSDQEERQVNEFSGNGERRSVRRYPEQLYFDLAVCDRHSGLSAMNTCKAKSLDVSLWGLRIESSCEFARDAVVSFILDPEFSSEQLLGVGEVKWCSPRKDSRMFEAGIAFSNYSTSEKMRAFLGL